MRYIKVKNIPVHIPFQRWQESLFALDGEIMKLSGVAYLAARAILQVGFCQSTAPLLPNDDELLARFCRLSNEEWGKIKYEVLAVFEVVNNRRYITHHILEENRAYLESYLSQRQNASKSAKNTKVGRSSENDPEQSREEDSTRQEGLALIDRLLRSSICPGGRKKITTAQKTTLAMGFSDLARERPEQYWRGLITLLEATRGYSRGSKKGYYLEPGGPFDKHSEQAFLKTFLAMWPTLMGQHQDYGLAVDAWLLGDSAKMIHYWGGYVHQKDDGLFWAAGKCIHCAGPTTLSGYCLDECEQVGEIAA